MSAIVCSRCGQRNRLDASYCVRCSSALAAPRSVERSPARSTISGLSLVPTLGLALGLALVGIGGAQAAGLLTRAMTPAQPSDLAALACTALQTQNYQQLTNAIGTTSTTTDASATFTPAALSARLHAIDATAGLVTACKYQQLGKVAASASQGAVANFDLSIQRAHQKTATNLVLVLYQQQDGSWKISGKSNLTGAS